MKTKRTKSLPILIIILLLSISSAFFLPACIGKKPPRYTIESETTLVTPEETIYGKTTDFGKSSALGQAKTIVVSSQGKVKVMPDTVLVEIVVSTERPTSEEAVSVNSSEAQNIIAAIKSMGENDVKIETTGYSLRPLYNYVENKPPVIYGFDAVTTLLVTTQKIEKIGNVISTAVEAGASDISSIKYDLSDEVKKNAKNEALTKAVKDANNKADAISEAMAVDIVEIYSVNEAGTFYPEPIEYRSSNKLKDAVEAGVGTPIILPQELEVTAEISVVYIFK
ncbi:MAG: SIMPL domain-containing protein [Actinomycetota bacterium]|nr:SIMPL domain-containing protein [Actinomycetota bacterium]